MTNSSENKPQMPDPSVFQAQVNQAQQAEQQQVNPLKQFYRHPKLFVELPTHGKFWPVGSISLSEDYTVPVLPMTAADEIIMKSPEGLLSGSSIVECVESCIPSITDAWNMPSLDTDALLIAIRIASFGHEMDVTTTCPKCKTVNDHVIDLREILDNIPKGDINNIVKVNGLTFSLKPYTFRFANEVNKQRFEQERIAKSMVSGDINIETQREYLENLFKELAAKDVKAVIEAIDSITTPDGDLVKDRAIIADFITNAARETIKEVKAGITTLANSCKYPDIKIKCKDEKCEHVYDTTITFDQANFFE